MAKLKFIHIPKTAGTSIEDWGYNNDYRWGRLDNETQLTSPLVNGWWHSPAKYWPRNNKYFCVIRDPIERVISAINFLYPEGIGDPNVFVVKTFSDSDIMEGRKETKAFIPQWRFIYDEQTHEQVCKYILRFSNLREDFTSMLVKEGDFRAYRDLPRKNVTKHKRVCLRDFNDKTLDLIRSTYAFDYEVLDNLGSGEINPTIT